MASATVRLSSHEMVVKDDNLFLDLDGGATMNSKGSFRLSLSKLLDNEVEGWDTRAFFNTNSFKKLMSGQLLPIPGISDLQQSLEQQQQQPTVKATALPVASHQQQSAAQAVSPDMSSQEADLAEDASPERAGSFTFAVNKLTFKSPYANKKGVAKSPFDAGVSPCASPLGQGTRQPVPATPTSEKRCREVNAGPEPGLVLESSYSGFKRRKLCQKNSIVLIESSPLAAEPLAQLYNGKQPALLTSTLQPSELPEQAAPARCRKSLFLDNQRARFMPLEAAPQTPAAPEMAPDVAPAPSLPAFHSAAGEAAPLDLLPSDLVAAEQQQQQLQPTEPITAANVAASLAQVPTSYTFPCNTQVSLCPHVWRGIMEPTGVMVNLRLGISEVAGEQNFLMGMYQCLNPHIITTGMPATNFGGAGRSAATRSGAVRAPAADNARKDKEAYQIEEVWLLKRDKMSAAVEAWHSEEPLQSGTVQGVPEWPGAVKVDILAHVRTSNDETIWLKAVNRDVPAVYDDLA